MLGEHVDCGGVVGAVSHIKSPHLWHEVKKETSNLLLALWKPENNENGHAVKKRQSNKTL